MQKNNGVSVVIVHYGHGNELFRCLDSIAKVKRKFKLVEIILVDNNEDKTDKNKILKNYSWIRYIPAPKNLGWCGGHNLGFKHAKGEYIFSLDSDVLIDIKSFKNIYEEIRNNQKTGIVSPRVINISGEPFGNATLELTPLRGIFYLSFIKKLFPDSSIIKDHLISDWDRKTSRNVEAIQLGAFIIRKKAYEDIKGFDEDLFLYFHENDISKRLREKGWKLFFDSKSEVIHLESKWTPKNTVKIRKIWAKCRFHYFKKHFGILNALIVEMFARMSKWNLIMVAVLILGIFLRFYMLRQNIIFNGEMGRDYMDIWGMIHGTHSWLIGPRTSHEWFFLPPIAYWIYAILLSLAKFSPIVINYFFAAVGSFAVFVCYYYVKKLFNERIAIVSSILLAVSPAWIDITRSSRYNMPAAIIFFPYIWILQKSIKDKGKSLFALGLILGLSMSFFPSPLLLIPAAIVCFIFYRVRPKLIYILYSILGFLIPNLTFIIYEASHRFSITLQLLVWIPYRVLGFLGLYHKNTVNSTVLSQNLYSIYQFFADSFVPVSKIISIVIFSFVMVGSTLWFKKSLGEKKKEISFILIFTTLCVSYLGLFLHGDPPGHYYYVIFPIPLILLAYLLEKTFRNKFILIFLTCLLGGLGIWNLIKLDWFNQDRVLANYPTMPPPYTVQLTLISEIVGDAKGFEISIGRIGNNDQFENDFANNYIYLLTIRGAKFNSNAKLRYTIVEERKIGAKASGKEIWAEDGIQIFKSVK